MKHSTLSSTQPQSALARRPTLLITTKHSTTSVRAMWGTGPLRRWSPSKTTYTPMSHAEGGFVGSYICAGCWELFDGLYLVREEQKWLCGPCKRKVQPLDTERKSVSPVQQIVGDHEQERAR